MQRNISPIGRGHPDPPEYAREKDTTMITVGHETHAPVIFERRDSIVAEARRARSQYMGGLVIAGVKALAKAVRGLFARPSDDRLWRLNAHTLRDIGILEGSHQGVHFGAQVPFQVANENLPRHVA